MTSTAMMHRGYLVLDWHSHYLGFQTISHYNTTVFSTVFFVFMVSILVLLLIKVKIPELNVIILPRPTLRSLISGMT